MSLTHEFAVIEKGSNINCIDKSMDMVVVSDKVILYIKDSLDWIDTYWNGKTKRNKGLNYYGYTKIRGQDIEKLKNILDAWIMLFDAALEQFILKGDYLIEENEYERDLYLKSELLQQLQSLRDMCIEAMNHDMDILHEGM